jgi:hypothetical protein
MAFAEAFTLDDVSDSGQDRTVPRFYMREKQNARATHEQGRPVFDLVEYVEIIVPGQNRTTIDRKVGEEDKIRWPAQYRAFIEKRDMQDAGTPLEQWPLLNRAQVAEFRALNITTVEQIASMDDRGLSNMGPGARELQKRAVQFLKPQGDVETELRSEIAALQDQVRDLKGQLQTRDTAEDEARTGRRGTKKAA